MKLKTKILIIILSIVALLVLAILCSAGFLTYSMVNDRADFGFEDYSSYGLDYETINLETADGLLIKAYEVAVSAPRAMIIIVSGIQNPPVRDFLGFASAFADSGYASLLLEMRAHGDSEGNKIELAYKEPLDVDAAVEYVVDQYGDDFSIIAFGTSMGGAVALNAAGANPEIDGVISQSAYSAWEDNMADQFIANGVPSVIARAQIPFTRLLLSFKYGFSNTGNTPKRNIALLDSTSVLLLHSKEDSQVRFSNYLRLKEAASVEIESYIIEGDNHFILETDGEFLDPRVNPEYFETLTSFIDGVIGTHYES